ncbi:hypothetical protein FOZ60_005084 [Perkinsus olseni]|uniref:EF-hand domain-containing protein n=2 Tax=Perkinsus olseni TaxID=32597 RepID=A0A7J6NRU2_PEROL|nr:hypothetical protein FOZ60_005084 [Perkinsus olseni]
MSSSSSEVAEEGYLFHRSGGFFIPPAECTALQLAFLTLVYGYVLFKASNTISNGSELLLLVPSISNMVGSVVLPVLGAVPDGMMVLFSGLGDDAQQQVSVGVGALAGSTIMLLTIPWFLAILGGRVNVVNGKPMYKQLPNDIPDSEWSKLMPHNNLSLTGTGISVGAIVRKNAYFMMCSTLLYLIIQIPASVEGYDDDISIDEKSMKEHLWSGIGMVICFISFITYLIIQYNDSRKCMVNEDIIVDARVEAIKHGDITLRGAMEGIITTDTTTTTHNYNNNQTTTTLDMPLILNHHIPLEHIRQMRKLLGPFFQYYDVNKDHTIDFDEFKMLMRDLHERITFDELRLLFEEADADTSGYIDFDEFVTMMIIYILECREHPDRFNNNHHTHRRSSSVCNSTDGDAGNGGGYYQFNNSNIIDGIKCDHLPPTDNKNNNEDLRQQLIINNRASASTTTPTGVHHQHEYHLPREDEDDDEDDIPEDLADLSPDEQQSRIKIRAAYLMGIGTLLVLIFSDPAVDVLNEIGVRSGINSFYISFILAPLASNASELVAAYTYAQKKTSKHITISISTLQGAASMNNTFCLGIFLAVVIVLLSSSS